MKRINLTLLAAALIACGFASDTPTPEPTPPTPAKISTLESFTESRSGVALRNVPWVMVPGQPQVMLVACSEGFLREIADSIGATVKTNDVVLYGPPKAAPETKTTVNQE